MDKLGVTIALLFSCGSPASAEPLSQPHQDRLAHLVTQDCGSCHGLKLTGGLGRPITSEALQGQTVDGVKTIILDGIPGTAMPPWRPLLSEQEAEWIAAYLLEISQ